MSGIEQQLADLKIEIDRVKEQAPDLNWFFVDFELTRLTADVENEVELFALMEEGA
jgi:hypothetical protein